MRETIWTLNPSDFAFLWEECKRCFWLKVTRDFRRPQIPMAKIFTVIDEEMRKHFAGRRTGDVLPALLPGVLDTQEYWVESVPLSIPSHTARCIIRGKLDCLVRFDDGSAAVIDFKTSERKAAHIPLYGRQLHSYAVALENASPNKLSLRPVTRLGLVVFDPDRFEKDAAGRAQLFGGLTWIEIQKNDASFLAFLKDVLNVLQQSSPPAPGPNCSFCQYRQASRARGF